MAKVCINCGKKIGIIVKEPPLDLCDGQILCDDCAKGIKQNLGKLYGAKSLDVFNTLKHEIIQDCANIYNTSAVDAVDKKITDIYERTVKAQIDKYQTKPSEERQMDARLAALKNLAEKQLLTTGYDFSGYKIVQYLGVISGEVVLGTGFVSEFSASFSDLFGEESGAFADKLETAKDASIKKLTLKSAEKGGNAIIGVDFDYITFASNMIGVVANGTSVVIERLEDRLE